MKRTFGCRGFFSITLMLLASFAQAQEKPNVVFIFCPTISVMVTWDATVRRKCKQAFSIEVAFTPNYHRKTIP